MVEVMSNTPKFHAKLVNSFNPQMHEGPNSSVDNTLKLHKT